jgi:hypothetical protein
MVLRLPSSICRALRVLLTCIALAVALPAATGARCADLRANMAVVQRSLEALRPVRSPVVPARPQGHPVGAVEREQARQQILPSALFVTRRTYLLNCSLRC